MASVAREGASGGASFVNAAQGVHIAGGHFNVAGRDIHHHHHHHRHTYQTGTDTIRFLLRSIPNFRKIQMATLGRATPGTGEWILAWETFLIWLDSDEFLKILWGSGMPGAGKTILASIVIRTLEARARASPAPICVCYLYIRYSDHSKATVQAFLEILVKQTVERHPSCFPPAEEVYAQHIREETQPSEEELLGLLHRFTKLMSVTFYVLDALDEAPVRIQLDLVRKLASLNIRLFITSRPLKAVEVHFPDARCFAIVAQDRDIELHITQEISRSPELSRLLADSALREDVVASIKEKCGGMFLHASLQLNALQECSSGTYRLHSQKHRPASHRSDVPTPPLALGCSLHHPPYGMRLPEDFTLLRGGSRQCFTRRPSSVIRIRQLVIPCSHVLGQPTLRG
ncbi:hypothetical protein BKA70DRAFT_140159 [Coprinopsis sp. MPI-PUGE-AT-0042]|nr:hypothetical protein BKA70DRAFT_140159 [Coprinopsis sp. MPI-PUGE-AT-0042]